MKTTLIALAIAGTSVTSATASTMEILSADRELLVIACGFDYEFDDCAGDRLTSDTAGAFDQQIVADLDDWYGSDISRADGSIFSNITSNRIELEYFADCAVQDAGFFAADAGVQGQTSVTFEVLDDVRVVFEGYAEGYEPGYFVAGAGLREEGGPGIASFGVQGLGDDETRFVGWLYAGTYTLSADIDVSTGSVPFDAAGEFSLSFRVYDKADFNTDGAVDRDDRRAFIAAYRERSADADFNGDGVTNSADRKAYIAAYRASREAASLTR